MRMFHGIPIVLLEIFISLFTRTLTSVAISELNAFSSAKWIQLSAVHQTDLALTTL